MRGPGSEPNSDVRVDYKPGRTEKREPCLCRLFGAAVHFKELSLWKSSPDHRGPARTEQATLTNEKKCRLAWRYIMQRKAENVK